MRKPTDIRFELRSFSSEQIDEMLDGSSNWRQLNVAHRDRLLAAMRRKEWNCANGETVAIDDGGQVVNGQHRLSAAAIYQRETSETVWFWVAYGTTADAVATMDQGKNRRLVDILRSEKVPYATHCASIAMSVPAEKKGGIFGVLRSLHVSTMAEGLDAWKRNRGAIQEWAGTTGRIDGAGMSRAVLVGQTLYHAATHNPRQARLFAESLISGVGLKDNDPVYHLRARLQSDRASVDKAPRERIMALVVKAWNAWIAGDSMMRLHFRATGPKAEAYPELRTEAAGC
jgi:hypothetical protein